MVTVTAFQTRKQHKKQEEDGEANHKNYRPDLTMHRVVFVSCEGKWLAVFRTQGLHRRRFHYKVISKYSQLLLLIIDSSSLKPFFVFGFFFVAVSEI